jgi:hypothetical protein
VVIELEQDKVEIIGEPLPAEKCQSVSPAEQAQNMAEFLQDVARAFGRGK